MDQDKDLQGQPTKTETTESDLQKTTTTETGFEPSERENDGAELPPQTGEEFASVDDNPRKGETTHRDDD